MGRPDKPGDDEWGRNCSAKKKFYAPLRMWLTPPSTMIVEPTT